MAEKNGRSVVAFAWASVLILLFVLTCGLHLARRDLRQQTAVSARLPHVHTTAAKLAPRGAAAHSLTSSDDLTLPAWPADGGLTNAQLSAALIDDARDRAQEFLAHMARPDPYIAVHSQHEQIARTLNDLLQREPELEEELVRRIDDIVCAANASELDTLLMIKMAMHLPSAYAERAVGCVFDRKMEPDALHEDQELWSALELWQASGKPAPEQLAAMEQHALDTRTRTRLARDELGVGQLLARWHQQPPSSVP